jgi:hypothetical protein
MHTAKMVLEHVALCKASEFVLRYIWKGVKTAVEMVLALLMLKLLFEAFKTADDVCRGLAFILLLVACGVISSANFRIEPATK